MMGPTRKVSICLLVSCVCLLFVFCNSAWTQQTKKANPRIKELQQKRLAVLEQVHDVAKHAFQNARTPYEDVHAATVALFAARLDYAETKEDRIKACDEAVKDATEWHEITQALRQSSRGTAVAELKAQAFLLEAQIARENAEADK